MSFEYSQAHTLAEAHDMMLAYPEVKPVAGATDIMVNIRAGKLAAAHLLDISNIEELKGIHMVDGVIHIGALTTIAEIASSQLIKEHAPALFEAAGELADPIIRNKATLGGNIANSSPSADTVPALMALDAVLTLSSKSGQRDLPLCEFYKAYYVTDLAAGELIKSIAFRPNPLSGFVKLGLRNAMAISVVNTAVSVKLDNDHVVTECRIAMGSVAPITVRARRTEAFFVGKKFSGEMFEGLEDILKEDIKPISDVRATEFYRQGVAPELIKRAFAKFME